jgi:hypothetical protein
MENSFAFSRAHLSVSPTSTSSLQSCFSLSSSTSINSTSSSRSGKSNKAHPLNGFSELNAPEVAPEGSQSSGRRRSFLGIPTPNWGGERRGSASSTRSRKDDREIKEGLGIGYDANHFSSRRPSAASTIASHVGSTYDGFSNPNHPSRSMSPSSGHSPNSNGRRPSLNPSTFSPHLPPPPPRRTSLHSSVLQTQTQSNPPSFASFTLRQEPQSSPFSPNFSLTPSSPPSRPEGSLAYSPVTGSFAPEDLAPSPLYTPDARPTYSLADPAPRPRDRDEERRFGYGDQRYDPKESENGRKNKHLKQLGYPVMGDSMYGDGEEMERETGVRRNGRR